MPSPRRPLRGGATLVAALLLASLTACSDDPGSSSQDDGGRDSGADPAPTPDLPADVGPDLSVDLAADGPDAVPPTDGPADLSGDAPASTPLDLQGTASAVDPDTGDQVDCHFFGSIDQLEPEGTGWTAFAQGEVYRTITRDGQPLEFQAFVAGPASLMTTAGGVELRWVGDQSAPEVKPFWKAIEVLTGTEQGELDYAGAWQCAPILPEPDDGFDDSPLIVDGTWTLRPL